MAFCVKTRGFLLIPAFISLLLFPSLVKAIETAPRISDREIVERLTRIEEGQKAIRSEIKSRFEQVDKRFSELREDMNKRFEQIDKRFDAIERQFDRLINVFIGIIVAFAGIVAITIGFAIWDRKTTLRPATDRVEKLENVLKRYAEKEPRLAEVLRSLGLL